MKNRQRLNGRAVFGRLRQVGLAPKLLPGEVKFDNIAAPHLVPGPDSHGRLELEIGRLYEDELGRDPLPLRNLEKLL